MKELSNSIHETIQKDGDSISLNMLHETGKRWAIFALDTYTDAFLTKALAISKAIAEFTSALKKDAHQE